MVKGNGEMERRFWGWSEVEGDGEWERLKRKGFVAGVGLWGR